MLLDLGTNDAQDLLVLKFTPKFDFPVLNGSTQHAKGIDLHRIPSLCCFSLPL
jgi:hypothetical protein